MINRRKFATFLLIAAPLLWLAVGAAVVTLGGRSIATTVQGGSSPVYAYGPASGGKPRNMVVLLQGSGMTAREFLDYTAPVFSLPLADTVFVAPEAPRASPEMPGFTEWFPTRDYPYEERRAAMALAAQGLTVQIADLMARYGVPAERVVLAGYSQGATVALYVAPRLEHRVAGVLSLSAIRMGHEDMAAGARHKPPICLMHGDKDDIVPVENYHALRGDLVRAGFDVTCGTIAGMMHPPDTDALVAGTFFLDRLLGEGAP